MAEPIGNADFDSEKTMEEIDKILISIEDGYGLTRNEAFYCLKSMALALTEFRPDDPGAQTRFHRSVLDAVDDGQIWARKVDRAIRSWGIDA